MLPFPTAPVEMRLLEHSVYAGGAWASLEVGISLLNVMVWMASARYNLVFYFSLPFLQCDGILYFRVTIRDM